jgi:hypothetical protein
MNSKNSKQSIIMNNQYEKSNPVYNKLIWDTIHLGDSELIKNINSKISDTYHAKINLINNLLYSTKPLPMSNSNDIIKFFNILSPLNNEYNLGSFTWDYILHDKLLIFQNSILKSDYNKYILNKYINPIKNILIISGFKVNLFQFKSKRFNKTIDLIFVIEL